MKRGELYHVSLGSKTDTKKQRVFVIIAASAINKLSSELTIAVIIGVCSGSSPNKKRKRQLVSRLGVDLDSYLHLLYAQSP